MIIRRWKFPRIVYLFYIFVGLIFFEFVSDFAAVVEVVDAQSYSSVRCYTCNTDLSGNDYDYCRFVGYNYFTRIPPAYECPSGKCIKMDVLVTGERFPRVFRFCDYNSIISNEVGDPWSYDRYQTGPLRHGYCSERVNMAQVRSMLSDVTRNVRLQISIYQSSLGMNTLNNPYGSGIPQGGYGRRPMYNDPYRGKRQSRYQDEFGTGVVSTSPDFSLDALRIEALQYMRVCRCDYDRCNKSVRPHLTMALLFVIFYTIFNAL